MRRRAVVFLLVLTALHVAAEVHWHVGDADIQTTDASYHFSQVVDLLRALGDGPGTLSDYFADDERQRYGQLWYAVGAVFAAIVDPNQVGHMLVGQSIVLWAALLFAAFLLGAELAPDDRRETAGVLAALAVGGLPGVFNYTRVFVLDLPLAAAVAWGAWALLRLLRLEPGTKAYRRGAWGAAAAALAAISIKANAAAFLAGPAWVVLRSPLKAAWATDRGRLLRGLGVATAAGAALAAWLLLGRRGDALVETFRDATWPGKALDYADAGALGSWPGDWAAGAWSHSWEVAYFTILQTFTPPLLLVVLAAYVFYFARRRGCEDPLARAQRDAVFWWFAIPTFSLLLLLRGLYDERYALPLLPQAAALVGVALVELPGRPAVRRTVAAAVIGGLLLTHQVVSFGVLPTARPALCVTVPGWADNDRVGRSLWLCGAYPEYRFMDRPTTPTDEQWPLGELEAALDLVRAELGRPVRAVFLDDLYEVFYGTFQRDLLGRDLFRHEDLLLLSKCDDDVWMTAMHGGRQALADHITATADVVLIRWGSPAPDHPVFGLRCRIPWDDGTFTPAGSIPLRDGTQIRWSVRKVEGDPDPVGDVRPVD